MVTMFLLFDAHEDGKYTKLLKSGKKYYKMAGIALAGISVYAALRKNPAAAHGFMKDAGALLQFVPMDKTTATFAAPFLPSARPSDEDRGIKRVMTSGNAGAGGCRRSVSETKKKFVAAQQGWKCGGCQRTLPAWFEVDHQVRLDAGGSNHVSNLLALCRDCHGKKTAMENL